MTQGRSAACRWASYGYPSEAGTICWSQAGCSGRVVRGIDGPLPPSKSGGPGIGGHRVATDGDPMPLTRYRRLFERSRDLICTVDMSGAVLETNPGCTAVLGVAPLRFVGMSVMEFVTPNARARAEALFSALAAGAEYAQDDIEIVSVDGRRGVVDVLAYPIVSHGRTVGAEAVVRDVTERHRLSDALT